MAEYFGYKHSLSQKNVFGNINPLELGYTSSFKTLKTHRKGIVSTSVAGFSSTTLTITHGLGYRPAFNAYYRDTLTGEVYQIMTSNTDIVFNRVGAEIGVGGKSDNGTIVFTLYNNNASSRNVDIFYEILIEDLVKF